MEDRVDGLTVGEGVVYEPDVPARCRRVKLKIGDWWDVARVIDREEAAQTMVSAGDIGRLRWGRGR